MADVSRLPAPIIEAYDWQLHGACRGADEALFFLPEGARGSTKTRRERAAKAICATCPVIDRCAEFALATREPYGVWGGLSPEERELLLSGPRAATPAMPVA
ncbi:MAG: WhiB family transcriptional regulator [Mycobacteriales bacterium]